jgi:hypothetical protein
MSLKKFEQKDIMYNVLETNPKQKIQVYDSKMYLNDQREISGSFTSEVPNVPTGFVSLFELNVDRSESQTGLIYPFVTKQGSAIGMKTISTTTFNTNYSYGDIITGSYPLSSSIKRDYFQLGQSRPQISALKNTLNYYIPLNNRYSYSSSFGDKSSLPLNLISVPSIMYGESINKGSVKMDFYISGTLFGTLEDENRDGALIQTGPAGSPGSGSVAGVVLYNEGFLVLTGSWSLDSTTRDYINDPTDLQNPSWLFYAVGANDGTPAGTIPSSSYSLEFEGINKIPTLTMFAHAEKGEMNTSNNPTFVQSSQNKYEVTSSKTYSQNDNLLIQNIVSSSYSGYDAPFKRTTYISKIGIYDDKKNLIGIATTATPVKKEENQNFTFKLKLDI